MSAEPATKKQKLQGDGKKFVIIGGGNSSAIMAVLAKVAGYHVSILTRKADKWSLDLGFFNDDLAYINQKEVRAKIDCVTSDPAGCIPEADIIFIAGLPIHLNPVVLENIKPHINREKEDLFIGTICGYGGFNWVCAQTLGKGKYQIFGCQLIPWCCGTAEYGKQGHIFGAKRFLRIATENGTNDSGISDVMAGVLQMRTEMTDFLASVFWPNNPVIHPPILYGVFKDWDGKTPYSGKGVGKAVPDHIYADLRDESVTALEVLDEEIVNVVAELSKLYPDNAHLKENYHLAHCIQDNYKEQVADKTNMKTTFTTCSAYGKHHIPYTTVEGGIIPTMAHKFFETDLPFGLVTFKDVANMIGLETPLMDKIIRWNQKLINKEYITESGSTTEAKDAKECVLPSKLGLTKETLRKGCRE